MNKQEQIKILEKELELAENYPFNKNKHDVAECLVERGIYYTPICKNITTNNTIDEFICSECGFQIEDFCEKRVDEDDGDITYHEFEMRYCPNCGAKVDGVADDVLENKEIQIRKIAKELYGNYCGNDICGQCKQSQCLYYTYAQRLYAMGCRIIGRTSKYARMG